MELQVQFRPRFDARSYPVGDDPRAQLMLSFEVDATAEGLPRVAADIVFVLDISGSMNVPDRYPLLKRALEELLTQVEPDDRVAVVVFSTHSEVITSLVAGAEARRAARQILERMDGSRYRFQGTNLSPGLAHALGILAEADRQRARRVYVLTDGELGDFAACVTQLEPFAEHHVEVHAYGFGAHFNAASLKELLGGQLGGSVKPICNERDIVDTFAHIAAVNRRIVARDARLTLELDDDVDAGDAFSFRPQERHLGRVRGRRLVRAIGALEAGRTYSLLVDLRLPPGATGAADAVPTHVGVARLQYQTEDGAQERSTHLHAARHAGEEPGEVEPEVRDASLALDRLRFAGDPQAELRATRARLELATREGRDPGLLDALRKQLDILEGRGTASLNQADVQYLNADCSTAAGFART